LENKVELREIRIKPSSIVLLVILTAIVTFVGTVDVFLNLASGGIFSCRYGFGPTNETMAMPIFSIVILLLVYPLKGRISTATLVSLYVVGSVIGTYGIGHFQNNVNFPVSLARLTIFTQEELRPILQSWWWMPPYDVIQLVERGGVPTNWGSWFNAIVFWSLYFITFYLFVSSVMLLFRRRWIDVEMLPFPYVIATYDVVRRVSGEEDTKKTMKLFLIGFVVLLIFEIQIMCTQIFPWWPDVLIWRGSSVDSTSSHGCVCNFTNDPIASNIVGWPGYTKNLHPFLIYYLAPLEVLFTAWVFFVIMLILAQIAYAMGYYTGIFSLGSACRILGFGGFNNSPLFGAPYYFGWMTMIGGTTAVAVMVIFNARKELASTIRSAMRGGRSLEEASEPFSYRQAYILVVVSAIILLAFLLSAGLSIGSALVVLLFPGFIYVLSSTYVLGLSGCGYMFEGTVWPGWPLRLVWPRAPSEYNTDWFMTNIFTHVGYNIPSQGPAGGAFFTIQSLKMGSMAKVNLRDVFLLLTISTIVSVLIGTTVRVWMINNLGAGRVPLKGGCSITDFCWTEANFGRYNEMPPEILFGYGAVGFILVTVLFQLKARFVWWPLHPIGFILATGISPNWMREWDAFLGAWIVKYIVLRVGGSKVHNDYAMPLVCGGIAGFAFSNLLAYIIGTVRFFVPF